MQRLKEVHEEGTFLAHCGPWKITEDKIKKHTDHNDMIEDLVRQDKAFVREDEEAHHRRTEERKSISERIKFFQNLNVEREKGTEKKRTAKEVS